VQPRGEFYDYVIGYSQNLITAVYKISNPYGVNYYFPSEYEINIAYAPYGNSVDSMWRESDEGKFRMRT